jgi:hypothetical protein
MGCVFKHPDTPALASSEICFRNSGRFVMSAQDGMQNLHPGGRRWPGTQPSVGYTSAIIWTTLLAGVNHGRKPPPLQAGARTIPQRPMQPTRIRVAAKCVRCAGPDACWGYRPIRMESSDWRMHTRLTETNLFCPPNQFRPIGRIDARHS